MANPDTLIGGSPAATRALPDTVAGLATPAQARGERWLYAFIGTQFGCALALLVDVLAPYRVVFRSLAIGMSLAYLVAVPRNPHGTARHPAVPWALASLVLITISAFNPNGGLPLAVFFHALLYLAVLAPLFWIARLDIDERVLGRMLLILWAYHTASSIVGLLQVYFPGSFKTALPVFISERQALSIRLASGEWVARPSGLSDTPGGAGVSGFYATLFGFGVVLARPFPAARALGLASMVTGMMCIYLSQVRVMLVMLAICFIGLAGLLVLSGRISGLVGAVVLGIVVVLGSFEFAYAVGGQMVVDRLSSLVSGAPLTIYHRNRGAMLEDDLLIRLPQYPLGAGLGHWGMMNAYFGSREQEIGAELQWSAWLLDGGVPLILTYGIGLVVALIAAVRVTLGGDSVTHRSWAAIVAAYSMGTCALCFSYAPFSGPIGMDFWVLNAVLVRALPLAVKTPLARLRGGGGLRQRLLELPRG